MTASILPFKVSSYLVLNGVSPLLELPIGGKKIILPLFPQTLGICAFGKSIYNKGHFLSKRKTALNVCLSLNGGDSGN